MKPRLALPDNVAMAAPHLDPLALRDRRRLALSLVLALALHAVLLWFASASSGPPLPQEPAPAPLQVSVVRLLATLPVPAAERRAQDLPASGSASQDQAQAAIQTGLPAPTRRVDVPSGGAPALAAVPPKTAALPPVATTGGVDSKASMPAPETGAAMLPFAEQPELSARGTARGAASARPGSGDAPAVPGNAGGAGHPGALAAAQPAQRAQEHAAGMMDLCPVTVKAQAPARAIRAGIGGMVQVRATIKDGKVRRVEILKSEPAGLFDAAVRAAMAQYVCRDLGGVETLAEQWFEFKLVE